MNRSRQYRIEIDGTSIDIHLGKEAQAALQQRDQPLYVEMELYFSCMIRKRVRFYEQARHSNFHPVTERLQAGFRPVMTQRCSLHDYDGPPPVTDFPIARADKFTPHWLQIDFHKGQWRGEFGYQQKP